MNYVLSETEYNALKKDNQVLTIIEDWHEGLGWDRRLGDINILITGVNRKVIGMTTVGTLLEMMTKKKEKWTKKNLKN